MSKNFNGVIIVESLKNQDVFQKVKILKTKVAGEIAPYKIRVRVDFRVL